MQPSDFPALFTMWATTEGMGLRRQDDTHSGLRRFLTRNPTTCFVAEENGALIGAILSGHDGRRGYIYHTAVIPSRRRCGVGTLLVRAVEDAMRREGIHKTALAVFTDNAAGNAFWEAEGFIAQDDLVYRNKSLTPENA